LINFLKRFIFKKYLNWRLKRWPEHKSAVDFQEVLNNLKHVLLILPDTMDLEAIQRPFISPLYKIFGDQVKISTFEKKNFRKEDSTWLGLPKKQYLDMFQSEKIDMIVDLSEANDKFSAYVCGLLRAPLKITLKERPFDRVYNLSIRAQEADSSEYQLKLALKYFADLKNLNQSKQN